MAFPRLFFFRKGIFEQTYKPFLQWVIPLLSFFANPPKTSEKERLIQRKRLLDKIRTLQIRSRKQSQNQQSGQYLSHFKGRGIDFKEVRQYVPGDEIKTIDWNVTARMNTPHIKVFHEEREFEVLIALDISSSQNYGLKISKKHAGLTIAASLAFSAEKNGDRTSFVAFTNDIVFHSPSSKANRVFPFIDFCLNFGENRKKGMQKTAATPHTTSLETSLNSIRRFLKKRTIVFLLCDFIDDFNWHRQVGEIAKNHDLVAVHLFDSSEYQLPKLGLTWVEDSESGTRALINLNNPNFRNNYYKQYHEKMQIHWNALRRQKVDYISLNIAEDYLAQLDRFLKKTGSAKRRIQR